MFCELSKAPNIFDSVKSAIFLKSKLRLIGRTICEVDCSDFLPPSPSGEYLANKGNINLHFYINSYIIYEKQKMAEFHKNLVTECEVF